MMITIPEDRFMKKRTEFRMYNILLPIWLLPWIAVPLWLILIPANFGIDFLVTFLSLKHQNIPESKETAFRHSCKICLAGFLSDFIGALFLFLMLDVSGSMHGSFWNHISYGLGMQPFYSFESFLTVVFSILISGFCIYAIDFRILKKDPTLTAEQAKRTALHLALFTAPYLYLIPSELIY